MSKSIIEPLLFRLTRYIKKSGVDILNNAILHYGDDEDIKLLSNELLANIDSKIILVDFVPFLDIGTTSRYNALNVLYKKMKFTIIIRKGIIQRNLEKYCCQIPLIICDEILNIMNNTNKSIDFIKNCTSYLQIYNGYIEKEILDLITNSVIEPPEKKKWIELQDGSYANKWVNVKMVLERPEILLQLVYRIGHLLTNGYTKNLSASGFIVSNNNSWVLASLLQIIFNKKLYILDRLGPHPRVNIAWVKELLTKINGEKLIVIEDVISTGREIDLLYLLLSLADVKIDKIIGLFDLNAANPVLLKNRDIISSLFNLTLIIKDYKRIPKYEWEALKDG